MLVSSKIFFKALTWHNIFSFSPDASSVAASRGDWATAKDKSERALNINISGVILGFVSIIITVTLVIILKPYDNYAWNCSFYFFTNIFQQVGLGCCFKWIFGKKQKKKINEKKKLMILIIFCIIAWQCSSDETMPLILLNISPDGSWWNTSKSFFFFTSNLVSIHL